MWSGSILYKFLHQVMLIITFFSNSAGNGWEVENVFVDNYDMNVQTYLNGRWSIEKSLLGTFPTVNIINLLSILYFS